MTCYVTHNGTIKLDNHVVGHVDPIPPDITCAKTRWSWSLLVNGSRHFSGSYSDRGSAFDGAKRACEEEASVIR